MQHQPKETTMIRLALVSKTLTLSAIALMAAALVEPANANTFAYTGHNVGSVANPSQQQLHDSRYYPLASLTRQEEGRVGLMIALTDDGTMADATIEQSSGFPRLDHAALEYVRTNYRYVPPAGEPMPGVVHQIVHFKLQ
jgi:TonB family protein